ncbi:unnamed protein product [Cylindrotheca closterium]|uniref:Uncharacterized protein n=1 Tax=Cylindrotheca closterium TaxID=2856 RepID=A0AAD2GE03_9STRA|nr:unnamed protein product [Cylindrotheca closterium]
MIKLILLTSLLSVTHGWIAQKSSIRKTQSFLRNHLSDDNFNPCWQDLYDDDCSMDAVYQSSFVASEWLKSMPCAAGIDDCDIPDELKLPGNKHGEDNMASIDILKALNIKRAAPISKQDNKLEP